MTLAKDIEALSCRPVYLSPLLWAYALTIGTMRKAQHAGTRKSNRDRGEATNARNDLVGAAAELMVVRHLYSVGSKSAAEHIVKRMVTKGSGDPAPDILGDIDVKCFPWRPNVIVNVDKMQRAPANGYLVVLARPFGRVALVSRVVPTDVVAGWPVRDFGYGDPAYALPTARFVEQWCGGAHVAQSHHWDEDTVRGIADDRACRRHVRQLLRGAA